MIKLDDPAKWSALSDSVAVQVLRPAEFDEFECMAPDEKAARWEALLCRPIDSFSVLNEVFFRARWEEVIRWQRAQSANRGESPVLLEIASGDADMIPQMMRAAFPARLISPPT